MILMRTMMTATTSKMWMNPPMVVLVTSPNIHRTISMIAMVVNIILLFLRLLGFV